jgi:hypothetical protein
VTRDTVQFTGRRRSRALLHHSVEGEVQFVRLLWLWGRGDMFTGFWLGSLIEGTSGKT